MQLVEGSVLTRTLSTSGTDPFVDIPDIYLNQPRVGTVWVVSRVVVQAFSSRVVPRVDFTALYGSELLGFESNLDPQHLFELNPFTPFIFRNGQQLRAHARLIDEGGPTPWTTNATLSLSVSGSIVSERQVDTPFQF